MEVAAGEEQGTDADHDDRDGPEEDPRLQVPEVVLRRLDDAVSSRLEIAHGRVLGLLVLMVRATERLRNELGDEHE